MASAITRARARSTRPAASAAPVAGSRHAKVIPRSAQAVALWSVSINASETCPSASRHSRVGRPSGPRPILESAAAERAVICATADNSAAWAQDANRRAAIATPASWYSSKPAASAAAAASHPACAGPGSMCSTASAPATPGGNGALIRPSAAASRSAVATAS